MRPARTVGNWQLPIRRTIGNWNSPPRRLLGEWQTEVVALTPADVTAFLARHPDTRRDVFVFESEVFFTGYNRDDTSYKIPGAGLSVPDSVFGNVLIFPDAAGRLHYTGNVPADIAAETNKPPFESPAGQTPLDTLISAAPWIVAAVVGLSLFNTARRR
jgi:hypothetical protein